MNSYTTIIKSLITEKSSGQQANGQYMFRVNPKSTKVDIKKAIKAIYGAEADKVRIMITPSKKRTIARGREWIKRPVMKKALVTIKGKKTIDPNKINSAKSKK